MYQFLLNFYQFYPSTISKENNYYSISYQSYQYFLYEVYDIEKVYFQASITKYDDDFYSFIYNRFHSLISEYDGHFYVLLLGKKKKNLDYNFSIRKYHSCIVSLQWYYQWIKRIEYIESYYSSIRGKNIIVDESIDYYLGLMELSIYLLRDYKDEKGIGCIQREKYQKELWHNPLNTMIDLKEREFGEYLKSIFWNNQYQSIDLKSFIYQNKDQYNFQFVLARVVYPNYYFDLLDEIVFFNGNPDKLKLIITRSEEFSSYFDMLFDIIHDFYPIKKVSF